MEGSKQLPPKQVPEPKAYFFDLFTMRDDRAEAAVGYDPSSKTLSLVNVPYMKQLSTAMHD
jgi:hypothetical protein